MQRIDGYYWIRYGKDSKWTIAMWQNTPIACWHLCFHSFDYSNSKDTSPYEINETPIKEPEPVFVDTDMGHGKCLEKYCNKFAVTDYNGHGHWVCQSCDDSLQSYFESEYN